MKKLSESIINERLKIDKNTKSIKFLSEVEVGDIIYFHNNYWTSDINDKYNKYSIYNLKVHKTLIDSDEDGDWFCIFGKTIDPSQKVSNTRRFWFKIDDIKDKSIAQDIIDNSIIVSIDRSLLEEAVDDNIDKEIEPLQKKIDEIQDKINDLISKKEQKYKNIDY